MDCNSNFNSFTEGVYIWHINFYGGQIIMGYSDQECDPGVEDQGHILKISPTILCLIIIFPYQGYSYLAQ